MRDELGTDLARTSVAWRWRECLPLRSDLKVVIGRSRSRKVAGGTVDLEKRYPACC